MAEDHTRPLTLTHGGQQFLLGHHLYLVDKTNVKRHHGNSRRRFDYFHSIHGQDAVDMKLWVSRSEVCAGNDDLKVGVFIQLKLNSIWQTCSWVSKRWESSMTLMIWRRMNYFLLHLYESVRRHFVWWNDFNLFLRHRKLCMTMKEKKFCCKCFFFFFWTANFPCRCAIMK